MIRTTLIPAAEPMSEGQLGRLLKYMLDVGTRVLKEEADERQRNETSDDNGGSRALDNGGRGAGEPREASR
jgi:hypothetical protein